MKKVLFVSDVPSHPSTAGNRARIRTLVDAVERLGHEAHYAALVRPGARLDDAMARRYGSRLYAFEFPRRRSLRWAAEHARRRLGRWLRRDTGWRWSIDAWYEPRLDAPLRELHRRERFDVVFIEYAYLSRAALVFAKAVRTVIDTHDRFTDRHRPTVAAGGAYEWFSLSSADERRALARADVVVAIQEREAAAFAALLDGTDTVVETVGHVFDPAETVARRREPRALIVGSDNAINADGARHFAERVLPLVRERLPAFELLVAGDVGRAVADGPGVRKLGRVATIADAYAQAAVALNPVRSGTGLCIKSLETMAYGLPLVTTRSGARGLERWAGDAFAMVDDDDPPAWAETICHLLRDDAVADALGRRARAAAIDFNAAQMAALRRVVEGADVGCRARVLELPSAAVRGEA